MDNSDEAMVQPINDVLKHRQSQDFALNLLKYSPNPVLVLDMDSSVRYVNVAFEKVSGYSAREIIGRQTPYPWWPAEKIAEYLETDKLETYPMGGIERRYRKKNGELFWVERNSALITQDSRKQFMLVNWVDITERKQADKALWENEEKYHAIFTSSRDGIALVDSQTGDIVDCNPEYERQTGRSLARLRQIKIWEIRPAAEVEDIKRVFLDVNEKGIYGPVELEFRKPDGTILAIDFIAHKLKIAGREYMQSVTRDISERKRMEEALKDSEKKYSDLVEKSNDGIIVIQDGVMKFANTRLEQLTGYLTSEEMGKPFSDFITPEYRKLVIDIYRRRLAGEEVPNTYEAAIITREGREIPVEINSSLIEYENRPATMAIIRDITERKKVEDELRWKTAFFEALAHSSRDGIIVVDRNGNRILQNQRTNELWKIPPEISDQRNALQAEYTKNMTKDPQQFIERVHYLQTHPEDTSHDEVELIDGRCLDRYSSPVTGQDGTYYGRIWTFHDITEHKQAEEALRESEENFRNSLESLPLGVLIRSIAGEPLYLNRALLDIYGYESIEEFRKVPIRQRHTPQGYIDLEARQEKERRGEQLPTEIEMSVVGKNGEIRRLVAFRKEVLWNGKKRMQVLYHDITERRRAEELNRKVQEYEELDRLKTAILSTVSHELRTPLATIKGYATMLLKYGNRLEADEKSTYLQSIDNATERLTDLVNHLLDMSRLDAGLLRMEMCPTRVSDLVKKAIAEARLTRKDHKIELVTSRRLPSLALDPRRIRQVIDNLIDNACKYSPEGTEVLVKARRKGKEVFISVTDHGVGIPASETSKIFSRMHRLEQKMGKDPGGLGLGLSLCKGLVEAHGGRIWVKSREGRGSTFYFSLPITSHKKE